MKRLVFASILAALPHTASAFCGFYVAGGDQKMFNDATQVVLMREGTRTVLAMQNNYKGPPEAFAMVIPVPVVLHEGDVKTLNKEVFEHVEQMGAPRLVEYWEQDPCYKEPEYDRMEMAKSEAQAAPPSAGAGSGANMGVTIEAKFVVGEYQILILSAKDSTGLDAWLRAEKYQIPAGAEPLLRPYVEAGSKFFVAKVDPKKVKVVDGHAALSPLRFHYDSEDFSLPIRLGMANSSGKQDLIVNILSAETRFEVANYKNVVIPTNFDVKDSVRTRFGEFYAALFDKTIEANPGAVVTEYAWTARPQYHCDPCPELDVTQSDLMTLGGDIVGGKIAQGQFVLSRLHARYGKGDMKDDLRFRGGKPITGGREQWSQQGLEYGATPSSENYFQARYAIRHWWTGPIKCASPQRGVWGGPPSGAYQQPIAATRTAFAPRGSLQLAAVIKRDLWEIGYKKSAAKPTGGGGGGGGFAKPPGGARIMSFSLGALLAALVLAIVWVVRRRRAR